MREPVHGNMEISPSQSRISPTFSPVAALVAAQLYDTVNAQFVRRQSSRVE
jgi:hypothetical protein